MKNCEHRQMIGTAAQTLTFSVPWHSYLDEIVIQHCLSHSAAASSQVNATLGDAIVGAGVSSELLSTNISLDAGGQLAVVVPAHPRTRLTPGQIISVFLGTTGGTVRAAVSLTFQKI